MKNGLVGVFFCGLLAIGCSSATADEGAGATNDELSSVRAFRARGTGYYPDSSALEGGFNDRIGKPLRTLQDYLAGRADYVSVAMDSRAFKYGTHLRIKQLEAKYGRAIDFRVVDTGGAFAGKGTTRIDVCTKSRKDSVDATINGTLDIEVADAAATAGSSGASSPPPAPSTPPSDGSGTVSCNGDGDCNPGNDGSGKICTSGACVPGCRHDYHCPGSKTCQAGMCR